ncbi:hypothetical protein ALT721_210003 [Alteromonas alvinellae]
MWNNAAIDITTVCQIPTIGASKAPFFLALELFISELDQKPADIAVGVPAFHCWPTEWRVLQTSPPT